MEFGRNKMHLIGICILVLFIRTSYSLDCYACNVSSSTLDEDGCYGIGSVKKCPGSSVCLAATYEIKSGMVMTYTTMQSCFPDMAGQECDNFIKSQRDLQRTATITPSTCYSCGADNCNKSKSKPNIGSTSRIGSVTIIIASVLSFLIAKMLIV